VATEPVFLLSLPRSGSTLVQRLLGAHPDIATTSEPWILLPYLYTLKRPGVYAEYGHRTAVRAIEDFCQGLPGGREEYLFELRRFVLSLYEGAAGGRPLFLDKSPRYHLIVDELMELFPEARFVFLWRQPLAVAASIIDSFGRGRWNLDRYMIDLEDGLQNLVAAARPNDSRCIALRYEDVVADPPGQVGRVLEFLGLDPHPLSTEEALAAVPLQGRMGDRTGIKAYTMISQEPLHKWQQTMSTALRRRWCRRYLELVGPHRLAAMGYSYDQLSKEVDALGRGGRALLSDLARSTYGYGQRRITCRLINPSAREQERVAVTRQRTLQRS
jgi:hypothetical protein